MSTELAYPTCADYSNTGMWLHLLPAAPTGKAACGRVSDEWRPAQAIDVAPRDVEYREAHLPPDISHGRLTVLICGHCSTLATKYPHRVATR